MKYMLGLAGLVFVALAGWRIGAHLSSDALGMAVGILFGILAGIPVMLIVLAGQNPQLQPRQAQPPIINIMPQLPEPQINVAPYIEHPTANRGDRIAEAFRRGQLHGWCVKESHRDHRSLYDFEFQIGTKVSAVDAFCRTELSQRFGSQFRAHRAGGTVQIREIRTAQNWQDVTTENHGELLSSGHYLT